MAVRRTEDGQQESSTETENCADDAEVSDDETAVYLAPTLCQKDPVTVLALDGNALSVRAQLPGFGPVASVPGGHAVVAFLDRDAQPPPGTTVPDDVRSSHRRYHLAFIDAATLSMTTVPVGDELPRYAFTPDGRTLLVDTPVAPFSGVRLLDVATRTLRDVSGPRVALDNFTVSPDSARVFLVGQQLWMLDVGAAEMRPTGPSVPPAGANLTADGATLLVTQVTDHAVRFLDGVRARETGRAVY